jgi:hypothetical protein
MNVGANGGGSASVARLFWRFDARLGRLGRLGQKIDRKFPNTMF